jgi:L-alanine-DL-glutamate epimerase-like enolase superfamily enzyme
VRIVSIESRPESIPLTRPYEIASRPADAAGIVFLQVQASSGQEGFGAASPEPRVTGETFDACRAALDRGALDWLIDRDVRGLGGLLREAAVRLPSAPAARAALDMALHDLFARELGVPLVEVLGRAHDALPTSITLGIRSVAESLEEASEYVARGFRVLKVKVGRSLEEDVERLARIRDRVGPGVGIRADANEGYSVEDARKFFDMAENAGVEFLEQPVPRGDFPAIACFPRSARDRIAADESLHDETDALRLASPEPLCGIWNVKLMKCGGIRPALRIAAVAETAGVSLMWGCMDESAVSIAAALHAGFASPATKYLDLDGSLDLSRDLFTGGFELQDGVMRTTPAPGLGVRPI